MSHQRPVANVAPVMRVAPMPQQPQPRPAPAQEPVVGPGGVPQQKRKFRPGAPLQTYLHRKCPTENVLTRPFLYLNPTLNWIKKIISTEGLFDEMNPSIVLCDEALEAGLLVRALHLTEIREKVCVQLVPEDSDEANRPFPAQPPPPLHPRLLPRERPIGHRPRGIHERESRIPPNRPVRLNERFKLDPMFLSVLRTLDTVENNREVFMYEELSKFLSQYILKHKQRFFDNRNIKMVVCDGDRLGAAFRVRAFHRTQVMTLLRTMLIPLTPQEEALLGPEPPSQARAQQALYRSAGSGYPDSGVGSSISSSAPPTLPLTEEHRRALTFPANRPSEAVATTPQGEAAAANSTVDSTDAAAGNDNAQAQPVSMETESNEAVASDSGISSGIASVSLTEQSTNNNTNTQGESSNVTSSNASGSSDGSGRTRKRTQDPSDTDSEQPASKHASTSGAQNTTPQQRPKRTRRSSTMTTITFTLHGGEKASDDDDDESVYSEQGYETVAICNYVEGGKDGNEGLEDSDESSEDDETTDTDEDGRGRRTVTAEFVLDDDDYTEFEVDSDADRRERKDREGPAEVNGDSADDTDVGQLGKNVISVAIDFEEHSSSWADSESEVEQEGEKDSLRRQESSEAQVGEKEKPSKSKKRWQCYDCREVNVSGVRYCSKCWQERKAWLPDRPKPRHKRKQAKQSRKQRQRKDKRTAGQPVKGSSGTKFNRSISLPGGQSTSAAALEEFGEPAHKSENDLPEDDDLLHGSQDSALGDSQEPMVAGQSQESQEDRETDNDDLPSTAGASSVASSAHEKVNFSEFMAWLSLKSDLQREKLSTMDMEVVKGHFLREKEEEENGSEQEAVGSGEDAGAKATTSQMLCDFCLKRKKTAGIIHGKIVHQVSCYPCAKKLYKQRDPCPICRRKIEKIAEVHLS